MRYLTAGESHGPGLVTIVEGLPSGLRVFEEDFSAELERRRQGHGRGNRMKIERDQLEIIGGIRHGKTLGSPVAVVIRNTEWPNWEHVMSPHPPQSGAPVTRPRPGHADLAGMVKYDTDDARDILERASARETAARTIAGVLAKLLLGSLGVEVLSHVTRIGSVTAERRSPKPGDLPRIDADPVRCLDETASRAMVDLIDRAMEEKDTLGGEIEVVAHGVPVGIGSHVQADRRLDAALAGALMSVPAIKAVSVGDGFDIGGVEGSSAHDEIEWSDDEISRTSNRAGGIEGGMSNGQPIVVRAVMKPISTLMQPLATVDMATGEPAQAVRERSDVCAVPAAGVVAEQVVAFTIANEVTRKFGGDTMNDLQGSFEAYQRRVEERLSR